MSDTMKPAIPETTRIEVLQQHGVTIVVPQGPRLDAEVAGDFRDILLSRIANGDRKLILDLPAVNFIDSSGLGALVSALKHLTQLDRGGDIRLANVQPSVGAVLEIIRLNRVFSQFPSVDDAVHSFAAMA